MKDIINYIVVVFFSPLAAICYLEAKLVKSDRFFELMSQLLALFPGLIGVVSRRCFYWWSLKRCSLSCYLGFGTLVTDRNAIIEDGVYVGNYCVLATVNLRQGTFIASRVSIPSAGQIHSRNTDGSWTPIIKENLQYVTVGPDVWIGEGAIVINDVGRGSLVCAGSLIVKPVIKNVMVGGNPQKILKEFD